MQGSPAGLMPTRRALRDSGARLLELAIVQHGGPDAVAQELGFRARRGNHISWEDLLRDLQLVIREAGTPPGIMPSRRAVVTAGRLDVYRCAFLFVSLWRVALTRFAVCSAFAKHGGVTAVARRAGLAYRKVCASGESTRCDYR